MVVYLSKDTYARRIHLWRSTTCATLLNVNSTAALMTAGSLRPLILVHTDGKDRSRSKYLATILMAANDEQERFMTTPQSVPASRVHGVSPPCVTRQ